MHILDIESNIKVLAIVCFLMEASDEINDCSIPLVKNVLASQQNFQNIHILAVMHNLTYE